MNKTILVTVVALIALSRQDVLSMNRQDRTGKIPSLKSLPQEISGEIKEELARDRSFLEKELESFLAAAKLFNDRPPAEQTDAEYEALQKRRARYIAAAREFNEKVSTIQRRFEFDQLLNDPARRFTPINAPDTNIQGDREAWKYAGVINQFRVDVSRRYEQEGEKTWCNIFVWDITRAMNVEIPLQTTAEMVRWLKDTGAKQGWRRVSIDAAQREANKGNPTVAIMAGHAAVVRPGSPGREDGSAVAQAGAIVVNASHLKKRFGDSSLVEFWSHE
ncbi:MAG: hypothetical protein HYZ01_13545 [Ignavibacteriales bacterium]|nr:hypothetical protein [Ignavibacteriales bacterium]